VEIDRERFKGLAPTADADGYRPQRPLQVARLVAATAHPFPLRFRATRAAAGEATSGTTVAARVIAGPSQLPSRFAVERRPRAAPRNACRLLYDGRWQARPRGGRA